jgi:hypothetical protein
MSLWDLLSIITGAVAIRSGLATGRLMGGGPVRAVLGVLSGIAVGVASVVIVWWFKRAVLVRGKPVTELGARLLYVGMVVWMGACSFLGMAMTWSLIRLVLGPQEHFITQPRRGHDGS